MNIYIYKDIIIEIALHMEDFINLSLTCKKYHSYIIENKDFWRRKILKDHNFLQLDNSKLKQTYILLNNIRKDPQYHYRKSVRKNNYEIQNYLKETYNVQFPYIGIIDENNENYFSVLDVVNLEKLKTIPNNILSLKSQGELSLYVHSQAMGIPYIKDTDYMINCMKEKLKSLDLIYKIGSPVFQNKRIKRKMIINLNKF